MLTAEPDPRPSVAAPVGVGHDGLSLDEFQGKQRCDRSRV